MPDAPVADVPLRRLWIALAVVVIGSFATLLYYGGEVYQEAPPIPVSVVTTDGQVLFTGDQIQAGQDVWRSIGGQELGSIWGHGAYHGAGLDRRLAPQRGRLDSECVGDTRLWADL